MKYVMRSSSNEAHICTTTTTHYMPLTLNKEGTAVILGSFGIRIRHGRDLPLGEALEGHSVGGNGVGD